VARRRLKRTAVPQATRRQSVVERILQEELERPGASLSESEVGINRAYRRVALYALTSALKGEPLDAGVLAAVVRSVELHAFAMELLYHESTTVTFMSPEELRVYVAWCHAFFSQLAMTMPSMPPPLGDADTFRTTLQANTAEARQFLEHIDKSSKFLEDEGMPEGSEADTSACESGLSVTRRTFVVLANALVSVARAWLEPTVFKKFNDAYNAGLVEIRDLRQMLPCELFEPGEQEGEAGTPAKPSAN
jgi:hypothetical protein